MGGEAGSNGERPGPATARLMDDQAKAVRRDARLRRVFVELDARAPRGSVAARTALCLVESLDQLFFGAFERSYARWTRRRHADESVAAGGWRLATRADPLSRDLAEWTRVIRRRAMPWR